MRLGLLAAGGLATIVFADQASAQEADKCAGDQNACQSIIYVARQYDTAFNAKELATMGALFTDDAVIMPQAAPPVLGRHAIENGYQETFKTSGSQHVVTVTEAHALGNGAWAIGEWSNEGPGPNNTTLKLHGHWGNVFVQESGTWKITMITWNMFPPSPPQ